MFEMVRSSISLFLRGKLFANPGKAYLQLMVGIIVTALIFLAGMNGGLPIWGAAAAASFVGGMLQPKLFRNLRYR